MVRAALVLPQGMSSLLSVEPKTLKQVMDSPEWLLWKGASDAEMEGLIDCGVWDRMPYPHDKQVVGTKPIFNRKIDNDREIEKNKTRLVAQGFRQVEGLRYIDSYSPIPTVSSVRRLLAIAATQDLELRHLNF